MIILANLLVTSVPLGSSVSHQGTSRVPSTDITPVSDFQVTEPLPNVTWSLPRNWAGNIPVDRPGHPNDTLFFWAWEKDPGSLTATEHENNDKPWGIWLNGGYVAPPLRMEKYTNV